MKTSREDSLAATKTAFGLSAFLRHNMRCGGLAALILMLSGVQLQLFVTAAPAESPTQGKNGGAQQWSVQVDEVDLGGVSLDPSFGTTIYENLLEELTKTKQFKQILRSGDRNADDVPGLLILKITVQQYTPVSETRRAANTVSGTTKLTFRVQLYTREGHLVLEQVVEGDVRRIGDNLRSAHNLAHNVAISLKRSRLSEPSTVAPEQEKTSKYQVGTITAVQSHQAADADPSVTSYEVSLRVSNTVYIVLYTPPPGADDVRYAAGRDLLVLVGEDTITYNDMLGNSLQVPILSRTTVTPQSGR
jgi:hypothetical protein